MSETEGGEEREATAAAVHPATTSVAAVGRNIPYARVWTMRREAITPAELMDALYDRGFMPGLTDIEGKGPLLNGAGLADARFPLEGDGFRIVSLSSARGSGCRVDVREVGDDNGPPDHPAARRGVPKARLVYEMVGGGPSNSDRSLTENIAELLMLMSDGVVQIGGLGTKGNRPNVYASAWLGIVKKFS